MQQGAGEGMAASRARGVRPAPAPLHPAGHRCGDLPPQAEGRQCWEA